MSLLLTFSALFDPEHLFMVVIFEHLDFLLQSMHLQLIELGLFILFYQFILTIA
jgi:hypothetical protein